MARTRVAKLAFNRGLVSRLGIARADIKRLAMAAEVHTNFQPRVLGSMMLRPGLGYIGATNNNAVSRFMPFVFSIGDKALLELSNSNMRVWISDALVTLPAVSTTVTNGTFDANIANWTDNDEAGGASVWVSGGYMGLTGNGTAAAIRDQTVTVAAADRNVEHQLSIHIERGPVTLRVGTSTSDDSYVNETELATGYHALAFTPTVDFNIRFMSRVKRQVLVDFCITTSGALGLSIPWAEVDFGLLRYDQSGDVIFVACGKTTDAIGYQQHRIERRGTHSWSVVRYYADDGPFMVDNVSPTTLQPSGLSGNITLTASTPYFRSTNVGSLFRLDSDGQVVTASITAQNQFTGAIRVEGVDSARIFTVTVDEDAAGAATFTLQRSLVSDAGPWTDVQQWTVDATVTFDDGLDNQIIWYRLGVKTGDYVNGTHQVTLNYTVGSISGVCRVTSFTNSQSVNAEVITDFGSTDATDSWAEGLWSDRRGWPTAVAFHEGRLTWEGRDSITASISDAFDGFDEEFEGDAGPINRSIGSGQVDSIQWALSLQRLLLGGEGAEFSVRSSSLDEPLTPTNFNLKRASTQGSAAVSAVAFDKSGAFAQRGGIRVFELSFGSDGIDYEASHLSALVPTIGSPGIVRLVVQDQPDRRIHALRSDGTVAQLVFDKLEQVICWHEIETDGEVEDAVVLPGDSGVDEDTVYYVVKRTINGATKRYLEKWALESQCGNLTLNRQADSFITYNQAASSTITGLTHLIGKSVVVWDNGKCLRDAAGDIATFVVSGAGEITATNVGVAYQATQGVVGLTYTASWKSAKLVELMNEMGGSLTDTQIIKGLALILADVHHKGLKFGQTLTESEMNELPEVVNGAAVAVDTVSTDYTTEKLTVPGHWSRDARLCLLAKAPRPCTVLAALAEVEHHG